MDIDALFYRAGEEYSTYEKHIPAPYIRTEIPVIPGEKKRIRVSGLGFYDLFVEGQKITKGLLAPYISNPDDMVYFDEYDITELCEGKTSVALGLILGNGMQNCPGGKIWDFDIARFRGVPRFSLSVIKDGEAEDIGKNCKWHDSPILFDDIRNGCFYDAGAEINGWCCSGFDDGEWGRVTPAEQPRGEYRICDADPIVIRQELSPVDIREAVFDERINLRDAVKIPTQYKFDEAGKKGILFDFGVNASGICRLKIDGKKGQRIFIRFCELVTSEGKPSAVNSGFFAPVSYGQSLLYICKGENGETFEPSFCYYGYRYAMVFGLEPEQVLPETLTYLVANSNIKERGSFECSNETMNALGRMTRVSDLANFWYFPTDCPHREKNGWTGDAGVSCEHMMLTLTPERSYREWLRNICKAQNEKGQLPGIVPTGGWGFEWGNGPGWDNVLSELCFRIWQMRDDLTPAEECADSLLRYAAYLADNRDDKGLIDFGLGDWLKPKTGTQTAPVRCTNTMMSMYIADKTARLFDAMGKPLHRDLARTLWTELREAFRRELIDYSTMTVIPKCQTAQAMAIYYNVFEPQELEQAKKVLVDTVLESGVHIDCGMLGLRVIFHALSDCGRGDLAFKMITRDDFPSYGMFVRQGLTSLPENFLPDDRHDNPDSLNHHFFGDIVSWFIQRVAGLRVNPHGRGANDFEISPDFLDALSFAKADYDASCGHVSARWDKTETGAVLNVTVPEAASGQIALPKGYTFTNGQNTAELKSGTYNIIRV
ncbi:MAG: glycoside hydrolase family 78 protein [Clostridiales bacterium]|nr:glycoside hydrolase family 78 protein [Clostridiales bacterium]